MIAKFNKKDPSEKYFEERYFARDFLVKIKNFFY